MAFEKRVELVGVLAHPSNTDWDAEDFPVSGAMGCFAEQSAADIHNLHKVNEVQYKGKNWEETKETILRETSGRGHGAVLDQAEFVFSMDNVTRASTLFLCGPQYAAHLQQSLRRATAERGFDKVGLEDLEFEGLMQDQFNLYSKMQQAGIPSEDARFVLPLGTKTTILTKLNARELNHLHAMSQSEGVPNEVRGTVKQMYESAKGAAPHLMKDRGSNYEALAWLPSPHLFAIENKTIEGLVDKHPEIALLDSSGIRMTSEAIDKAVKERDLAELANLKHYHFTFLAPMSLATFHQATRQRTWDQSVQTIYSAVERGEFVTPRSISNSEFNGQYQDLVGESLGMVQKDLRPESLMAVPHALKVRDLIHVNGWNAVHSIGKRTCTEAQWEIRDVAQYMASEIKSAAPELGRYAEPQGIVYGRCPERKPCGRCKS